MNPMQKYTAQGSGNKRRWADGEDTCGDSGLTELLVAMIAFNTHGALFR